MTRVNFSDTEASTTLAGKRHDDFELAVGVRGEHTKFVLSCWTMNL